MMNVQFIHHETDDERRVVFHHKQQQQAAKLEESMTELTLDETDFHADDEDYFGCNNNSSNDHHDCAAVCFSPLLARFFADVFRRTTRSTSNVIDDKTLSKIYGTSTSSTDDDETAEDDGGNETSSSTTLICSDAEEENDQSDLPVLELNPEMPEKPKTYQLDDFQRHKILGEGQFGQVWLVSTQPQQSPPPRQPEDDEEDEENAVAVVVHQQPYALKVLSKYDLIMNDEVQQILSETSILSQLHHPFIVRLEASFQDESFVYLLQEFCQGGELFSLLCSNHHDGEGEGGGLPEPQAAFYATCIADALSYLHRALRIVYRDLKPENCMIDRAGYPKLIDMGYAKVLTADNNFKAFTFCGTPRYLAPEIIDNGSGGQGYSFGADHWALGALVYEMLAGFHPFYWDGVDESTLLESICDGHYDALPEAATATCVSAAAADFVARLLVTNPAARLGCAGNEGEILQHAWLRDHFGADRGTALHRRQIAAPWIPACGNGDPLDASCFDDWDGVLEDRTAQNYPRLTRAQAALFAELP